MLAIIFWFLTFYFLYKFAFEFVIPLIAATKNVRSKMEDVNSRQQRFDSSQRSQEDNSSSKSSHNSSPSKGDYIDFEEI